MGLAQTVDLIMLVKSIFKFRVGKCLQSNREAKCLLGLRADIC